MFTLNLSIFTVFLKNKNIIFKTRRSKVTDYAALNIKDISALRIRTVSEKSINKA